VFVQEASADVVSPLSQADPSAPRGRATSLKAPQRSIHSSKCEKKSLLGDLKKKGLTVTKPVHPAARASSNMTNPCTAVRAVFAPSAKFNATPNRMLT
jgi:hypothetical protein